MEILIKAYPVLEAEASLNLLTMTRAAQAKDSDYKSLHRELARLTKPARVAEIPLISLASEAWFIQNDLPYRIGEA